MLESFLLSAADALLKAGRSKLVFDFDFEILNIPSNFCGTTIAQYYQNRRKKDKCIQKNILILKYWISHQTFQNIAYSIKLSLLRKRKTKSEVKDWNLKCTFTVDKKIFAVEKKIIVKKKDNLLSNYLFTVNKKYNLLSEKYS